MAHDIWNPRNPDAFRWEREAAEGIFHDGYPNENQPGVYSDTFTVRGTAQLKLVTDNILAILRERKNFRLIRIETKKFVPNFVRTIHYEIMEK